MIIGAGTSADIKGGNVQSGTRSTRSRCGCRRRTRAASRARCSAWPRRCATRACEGCTRARRRRSSGGCSWTRSCSARWPCIAGSWRSMSLARRRGLPARATGPGSASRRCWGYGRPTLHPRLPPPLLMPRRRRRDRRICPRWATAWPASSPARPSASSPRPSSTSRRGCRSNTRRASRSGCTLARSTAWPRSTGTTACGDYTTGSRRRCSSAASSSSGGAATTCCRARCAATRRCRRPPSTSGRAGSAPRSSG